jgi:hypothetical protein
VDGSAADLLRPITDGDLRGWQGLPPDLSLTQLTAAFPRDSDWSGTAQLGRSHREASYLWVDIPGADGKLRVWFVDERVIMLDRACAGLGVHAHQLVDLLAETPAALDTWQGTLSMSESELVFPAHGLAAFISRETDTIWHLALFAPLALETYQNDLRISLKRRRFQLD